MYSIKDAYVIGYKEFSNEKSVFHTTIVAHGDSFESLINPLEFKKEKKYITLNFMKFKEVYKNFTYTISSTLYLRKSSNIKIDSIRPNKDDTYSLAIKYDTPNIKSILIPSITLDQIYELIPNKKDYIDSSIVFSELGIDDAWKENDNDSFMCYIQGQ